MRRTKDKGSKYFAGRTQLFPSSLQLCRRYMHL